MILLLMISVVLVGYEGDYRDFIQSQAITRKNMQFAVIIVSLLLIFVTAFISWLVALYGSFKIAGPLYRFTQNLAHCHQTDRMLNIRSDDCLQDLSEKIINAAKELEQHKLALSAQLEKITDHLKRPAAEQHKQELAELLQQLKQLEARVKLNE
ncbi:MAG: hypothetical protein OEY11_10485 [Gammaproteobacteria bacterium]|nr:hypothetical protein [Gammaproteobacteria bacterium]